MYGSSTTLTLLKGMSYNRGVRAHNAVVEAMFHLEWRAFVQWLSQQGHNHVDETLVIDQAIACYKHSALDEGNDVPTTMHAVCDATITPPCRTVVLYFHFHHPSSYLVLLSCYYAPLPLQPLVLDLLCDFPHFRCPSYSFISYIVQLRNSAHPS